MIQEFMQIANVISGSPPTPSVSAHRHVNPTKSTRRHLTGYRHQDKPQRTSLTCATPNLSDSETESYKIKLSLRSLFSLNQSKNY